MSDVKESEARRAVFGLCAVACVIGLWAWRSGAWELPARPAAAPVPVVEPLQPFRCRQAMRRSAASAISAVEPA